MKIHEVLFSVFSVLLAVMCEEHHHIGQRVLENQVPGSLNQLNGSTATDAPTSNISSVLLPSVDQSAKLEQQLNLLQKPSPIPNSPMISNAAAAATSISTWQQTGDGQKFNVSSLLRTNSSVQNGLQNVPETSVQGIQDTVIQGNADAGLQGFSTGGVEAPKLFPTGTSVNGTKVIEGDKEKLQTLIQQMNSTVDKVSSEAKVQSVDLNLNGAKVDTEVKDLLQNNMNASSNQIPSVPKKAIQLTDKINDDTELIENGQNTEDQLRNHYDPTKLGEKSAFQQPYLAAILVSSLVAASVLCYAGMLLWRRYLENRYGSRTMLVDEEEFDGPNDLRHFSI